MLPCKHRPFGFFGIVTNIIFKINHHNRTKLKDIRTKIPVRKKQRTPDLKTYIFKSDAYKNFIYRQRLFVFAGGSLIKRSKKSAEDIILGLFPRL